MYYACVIPVYVYERLHVNCYKVYIIIIIILRTRVAEAGKVVKRAPVRISCTLNFAFASTLITPTTIN